MRSSSTMPSDQHHHAPALGSAARTTESQHAPAATARSSPHAPSPHRLLTNVDFMLLWAAYGVSAMGDHISEMALLKTQDALNPNVDITPLNARLTFMFFLPFFVLAPFMGLLADRLPRKLVMIAADLARAGIMFLFASLIALTTPWGSWGAFVPLLAIGAFAAMFSPARSALLPSLVHPRQLVRANGMISGLGIIATMAAAKVSGYLADHYDPIVSFRVDAATFFASALLLALIRERHHEPDHHASRPTLSPLAALDGLRYARAHRHVRDLLMVGALVWFCGSLVNTVIPAVVRDSYHGTYSDISNYRAFLGLGFILGATGVTILGSALRAEVAITWGFLGVSLGIGLLACSTAMPWTPDALATLGAVAITLSGAFGVSVMAGFNSLLQRTVADRFRGRVFGVNDLCTTSALLVATGLLAFQGRFRVDRHVGWILALVAVITLMAAVVTLRVRLRRSPHGPLVTFLENLGEFVCKYWWRMERIGTCTVPRTGPVIVTANHICHADPVFLAVGVRYRLLSFMIAAEYANLPIVGFFVRVCSCIPVRRGEREIGSTKQAMRHLEEGRAVSIFIQGGIPRPGETKAPKDGVALLALRTGAPVIPAHISGGVFRDNVLPGLLVRHRARVRFGPPVDLDDLRAADHSRENTRAATMRIWNAIQSLAPREEGDKDDASTSNPGDGAA